MSAVRRAPWLSQPVALSGALLGVVTLGLWVGFDVRLSEVLRYVGYEAVFTFVPGLLAYRALFGPRGGALAQVSVGWPLGYVLEAAVFIATAALDLRDLFAFYPVVAIGALGALAWRRRGRVETEGKVERLPPVSVWLVALACAAGIVYVSFGYFAQAPRPDESGPVAYFGDFMYHLAIAAEAKHHWPLEQPGVAGQSLRYHVLAHLHMAGASQVTGVELSTILLRLFPIPLIVLMALQLVHLSRRVGRVAWVGPLAVGLLFCAGELDLDPARQAPFLGNLIRGLFLSPSFLFAFVFFIPAVALIWDRLEDREGGSRAWWIVVFLLLTAANGAKGAVLPLVIGGLGLFLAWEWVLDRRVSRAGLDAVAVSVAAFAASYAAFYSGGGDTGMVVHPFASYNATLFREMIGSTVDDSSLRWVVPMVVSTVLFLLPLAGIGWLFGEWRLRVGPGRAFVLSMLFVGFAAFLLLRHPGGAQVYFLLYAYVTALPLSAEGLVVFLGRWSIDRRRPGLRLGVAVAAVLGVAVVASVAPSQGSWITRSPYLPAYAAVAAVIGAAALLAAGRTRMGRPALGRALALAVVLAVAATALDAPTDWVRKPALRVLRGQGVYRAHLTPTDAEPQRANVLDPGLYAGLRWIRGHTRADDVLAVNNHFRDPGRFPLFYYYSALAERRVFLESWLYTPESFALGYADVSAGKLLPFPQRLRLNDAAFRSPNPQTLGSLRRHGVSYLVVDKVNAGPRDPLAGRLRPLYANRSIAVYGLRHQVL
jgi:hypothetical protein